MKHFHRSPLFHFTLFSFLALCSVSLSALEPVETFSVWPGKPPGDTARSVGEEHIVEGRPRPFYQITDVSHPTVSVYQPPKDRRSSAAILVCPGGGLQRLAIEHEGFEVADWLISLDVTVFLLKYRVPAPATVGLQDAQRAMSLIRSRAAQWGIDPDGIGILGFSAGGEIAAWLSTHYNQRQYEPVDKHDNISCRPDFAALVYPGGLLTGLQSQLKEPILNGISSKTPPTFLAHAHDDSCENSLLWALALKRARVPFELHVFQEGGHGFGVRDTGHPVGDWKGRFKIWAQAQGFLDPAPPRQFARAFHAALPGTGALPKFTQFNPAASLDQAYLAQKHLVRRTLLNDRIAGFKGAAVSAATLARLGLENPMTAILFQSGRLAAEDQPVVERTASAGIAVETELGYILGVDVGYHVLSPTQARDAVEAILPVIELPAGYGDRLKDPSIPDTVAMNVGSSKFIVGPRSKPGSINPDDVKISLRRDGIILHQTTGAEARNGQWDNLKTLINQIIDQGYTIRRGDVIISGALGKIHPGTPARYSADYGDLGTIEFQIR